MTMARTIETNIAIIADNQNVVQTTHLAMILDVMDDATVILNGK